MKQIKVSTFAQLPIPLVVATTNLSLGKVVYFQKGLLAPAVAASGCIPGLFRPVKIEDSYYVDRHILDLLPVVFTRSLWHPTVGVAVNIANHIKPSAIIEGSNVVNRCIEIAYASHIKKALKCSDVVSDLYFEDIPASLWITKKVANTLYTQGSAAAQKMVPAIRQALAQVIAP